MIGVSLGLIRLTGPDGDGPAFPAEAQPEAASVGDRPGPPTPAGGPAVNGTPPLVRFQVCDLIHPHPAQVLLELFHDHSLEGEVAAVTTDGETPYLVVRVAGLAEPIIVPRNRTQFVEGAACGPPSES
jgi:hypothetical protein